MKRILFLTFLSISIFLVGCNTLSSQVANIEPAQREKIETNLQDDEVVIEDKITNLSSDVEISEVKSEAQNNQGTKMTYDEGHQKIEKVINKLNEFANDLDRGDYIGYIYSTGNLYKYLLAIYYKGEDLSDFN